MEWMLRPKQKIPEVLSGIKLNNITTQLLLARGISDPREVENFFAGKYENLHSPFDLSGMKEAVQRIGKARNKKERVCIFGDYDADGLTSTTLLKEVLEEVGLSPEAYIPDRNKEGYGLNKKAIDLIISRYNPSLIITVDCGISNREEIEYIRQRGMDAIVTDHHAIPKKIPENCTIINPKLPDQKYLFQDLAGVGVAFEFSRALFEKFLPQKKEQLKWLLDIVAIGTIADCVPLVKENRIFAKFGLIVLQKTKRTGIVELVHSARLQIGEKNPPSAENISFHIGPRLNASGRVDHADLALSLLLEKNPVKARILALEVEGKNSERQKISQQVYSEVKATLGGEDNHKLIVRSGRHWPLGIVGVVAGKICDEYHCPVFLFREDKKILEGSGRSIEAFDIVSAVAKIDKHVEKYGGHKQAMGLKIKPKNIELFEKEMLALIAKEYEESKWGKKMIIDAEITPEQIDWDLLSEIRRFEPFGEGNREPVFLSKNLIVREMKLVGNGQKHLKVVFQAGQSRLLEGIFWKGGDRFSEFQNGDAVSVVFHLRSNEWNGNRKLELSIIDIKNEKQ